MQGPFAFRVDVFAKASARSFTASSKRLRATKASTSFHSMAPLSLDAFDERREHVRAIAAHHPFVDETREPPRSREHRQKRRLGKRHCSVAIVHQQDFIGGECQLVASARRDAIQRGEIFLTALLARLFHAEPGLVRVLTEIDFEVVGRAREHIDVGARPRRSDPCHWQ